MNNSRPPTKAKVKDFQKKLYTLIKKELQARAGMRELYDKFMIDVQDERVARRHVLYAYFQVQKFRLAKMLAHRLEFHPMFGNSARTLLDSEFGEDSEDVDDSNLL